MKVGTYTPRDDVGAQRFVAHVLVSILERRWTKNDEVTMWPQHSHQARLDKVKVATRTAEGQGRCGGGRREGTSSA